MGLSFFTLPLELVGSIFSFCDIQSVFRFAACSHETLRLVSDTTPALSVSYTLRRAEDARAAYSKLALMRSCSLKITIKEFDLEFLRVPPNTTGLVAYRCAPGRNSWPPDLPFPPRLSTLRTDLRIGRVAHLPLKLLHADDVPETLPSTLETLRLCYPPRSIADATRLGQLLPSLSRLCDLDTMGMPPPRQESALKKTNPHLPRARNLQIVFFELPTGFQIDAPDLRSVCLRTAFPSRQEINSFVALAQAFPVALEFTVMVHSQINSDKLCRPASHIFTSHYATGILSLLCLNKNRGAFCSPP